MPKNPDNMTPDERARVLAVLAGATYADGGRVVSDGDALVLAERVVAALACEEATDGR